jgi:hypothetical protein
MQYLNYFATGFNSDCFDIFPIIYRYRTGYQFIIERKRVLHKCIDTESNLIHFKIQLPAGMCQIMNGSVAKKKVYFSSPQVINNEKHYVVMKIKNYTYVKKAHKQIKMLQ